jgi:hypothetical protein
MGVSHCEAAIAAQAETLVGGGVAEAPAAIRIGGAAAGGRRVTDLVVVIIEIAYVALGIEVVVRLISIGNAGTVVDAGPGGDREPRLAFRDAAHRALRTEDGCLFSSAVAIAIGVETVFVLGVREIAGTGIVDTVASLGRIADPGARGSARGRALGVIGTNGAASAAIVGEVAFSLDTAALGRGRAEHVLGTLMKAPEAGLGHVARTRGGAALDAIRYRLIPTGAAGSVARIGHVAVTVLVATHGPSLEECISRTGGVDSAAGLGLVTFAVHGAANGPSRGKGILGTGVAAPVAVLVLIARAGEATTEPPTGANDVLGTGGATPGAGLGHVTVSDGEAAHGPGQGKSIEGTGGATTGTHLGRVAIPRGGATHLRVRLERVRGAGSGAGAVVGHVAIPRGGTALGGGRGECVRGAGGVGSVAGLAGSQIPLPSRQGNVAT